MKNYLLVTYNVLFLFLSTIAIAQKTNTIEAKIERTFVENEVKLKALVTNNTTNYQELNYLLVSIKKGSTGNLSNNKQSGKFSTAPNESKILSEMSVNLDSKDALKAYLYIRDEQSNKLIAKDSLEIIQNPNKNTNSIVEKEKAFELNGLTIDETKSKVGKDFYDLFFIQYNQITDKYQFAITITELPIRGTSGQINVQSDDKIIYSFVTNPSEDYLMEQLDYTMQYIKEYNSRRNLIKNEFIY